MIYLDYSATTPVDIDVLNTFNKTCNDYIGNANSLHKLGIEARNLMEAATKQIGKLLNCEEKEVIFTSGATEANNLAIKGTANKYKERGNHIITTKLEHASVKETVSFLEKEGFEISYVNLLDNGLIDINHLEKLIKDKTILISINYVNSELGIIQPIDEIAALVKRYPKIFFHVDATQAIGKIEVKLNNVDLVSFSAHKFFGLKGIGCLLKNKKMELEPILHGGRSQSKYRGGTPPLPLIVSTAKALRLALDNVTEKYNYVFNLKKQIIDSLNNIDGITINSNDYCIPHIINISISKVKPEPMIHALAKRDIYISSQSACSNIVDESPTLKALGKNNNITTTSLRISLSYKTTKEDVTKFLKIFKEEYDALKNIARE